MAFEAHLAAPPRAPTGRWAPSPLRIAAYAAAILAAAPILSILWLSITGQGSADIPAALIGRYAGASALLALLVATGSILIGASAAWLVVRLMKEL